MYLPKSSCLSQLLRIVVADSDDDIVMPTGPPPGQGEEVDSDDDIPMPEGPPPSKGTDAYGRNIYSQCVWRDYNLFCQNRLFLHLYQPSVRAQSSALRHCHRHRIMSHSLFHRTFYRVLYLHLFRDFLLLHLLHRLDFYHPRLISLVSLFRSLYHKDCPLLHLVFSLVGVNLRLPCKTLCRRSRIKPTRLIELLS